MPHIFSRKDKVSDWVEYVEKHIEEGLDLIDWVKEQNIDSMGDLMVALRARPVNKQAMSEAWAVLPPSVLPDIAQQIYTELHDPDFVPIVRESSGPAGNRRKPKPKPRNT